MADKPDEEGRSKQPTKPTVTGSAESVKSAGAGSRSSTSAWDFRRAEIEWTKLLQEAEFEYQHRLASAFAHYNLQLKAVWQEVREEELAALDESAALAARSDATPERRVDIAREWADRIRAIGRAGNDRMAIVARALAEEQQKAWLDAAEKRRKGYDRYVEAIGRSYVPGGGAGFMLAGDEGPVVA